MNTLIFSRLNPVQFYKDVPDTNAQYNSRLFDDWFFSDTVLNFEQMACWWQPWQSSDTFKLQLQCNYGPINLQVIRNSDDAVIDTLAFSQIMPSFYDPTMFIYERTVPLAGYPVGDYYLKITFGSPVALTLRSERIVLSVKCENTLLLEGSHPTFYGDMIFETGFSSIIRLPGTLKLKGTAAKRTTYEDQALNMTMVRSRPYRVWRLRIGVSEGVPDYIHDKLEWLLGCRNLLIDGKNYTVNGDSSQEESELERYPMRGWSVELRETINRASRIYENEVPQDQFVAVLISSDSKGFGNDNGGNESVISDVI